MSKRVFVSEQFEILEFSSNRRGRDGDPQSLPRLEVLPIGWQLPIPLYAEIRYGVPKDFPLDSGEEEDNPTYWFAAPNPGFGWAFCRCSASQRRKTLDSAKTQTVQWLCKQAEREAAVFFKTLKNGSGKSKSGSSKRIQRDYGVPHLNSYSDEAHQAKEAFLKDAQSYLRALAKELDWDGDVRVNKAGIAVSGEVYSYLFHPVARTGVFVELSETGSIAGAQPSHSGITIMWRTTQRDRRSALSGQNHFEHWFTSVEDLATKIRSEVALKEPIVDPDGELPDRIAEQHSVLIPSRHIDLSQAQQTFGFPVTLHSLRSWSAQDLRCEREALMSIWDVAKQNDMLRIYLRLIDSVLAEKHRLPDEVNDNLPEPQLSEPDETRAAEIHLRAMVALTRANLYRGMNKRKFERVWQQYTQKLSEERWIENCSDLGLIEMILTFYATDRYTAPLPGALINRFQNRAKALSAQSITIVPVSSLITPIVNHRNGAVNSIG